MSRSMTVTAPGVSSNRCGKRETDSTSGTSVRKSRSDRASVACADARLPALSSTLKHIHWFMTAPS